ncbi:MAG TPA: hypothetical protein VK444_03815 [Methanobacteriaceae archaeon]|nr:hypothetical protein [Methanobacteriaceae archaeon]
MAFLKDTEREQLRQLVKACLLEISKLKIELKKCQKESSRYQGQEKIVREKYKEDIQEQLLENQRNLKELTLTLEKKDEEIKELLKIKKLFQAVTSKPKRDLTSFQTQIYLLLPDKEDVMENLYTHIREIGFHELTSDNFEHALRNLERKGYFKSTERDNEVYWEKIDKD